MAKKPREPKAKPLMIPGDIDHNIGFIGNIGALIINWSNTESVFMSILQTLLDMEHFAAAVVWHSLKTSEARLNLVMRLAKERVQDPEILTEVESIVARFKRSTRIRNFYCHATYEYDAERKLDSATSVQVTFDDDPLRFETKPFDAATANEIVNASHQLQAINDNAWEVGERLDLLFGTQHVKRPVRPPSTK